MHLPSTGSIGIATTPVEMPWNLVFSGIQLFSAYYKFKKRIVIVLKAGKSQDKKVIFCS